MEESLSCVEPNFAAQRPIATVVWYPTFSFLINYYIKQVQVQVPQVIFMLIHPSQLARFAFSMLHLHFAFPKNLVTVRNHIVHVN